MKGLIDILRECKSILQSKVDYEYLSIVDGETKSISLLVNHIEFELLCLEGIESIWKT